MDMPPIPMIYIVNEPETEHEPSVDKAALSGKVTEAEQALDEAEAGSEPGQYPQAAIDALQLAVEESKAVLEVEEITQEAVDIAVTQLTEAISTFAASVNVEMDDSDVTAPPWPSSSELKANTNCGCSR